MRIKELNRRRSRKEKLHKLRHKYSVAKTDDEKSAILSKMSKVSPLLSKEEFLAPLKAA